MRKNPPRCSIMSVVRVFICRHGDREDYDVERGHSWRTTASSLASKTGQCVKDPPISALGHEQARETGKFFEAVMKTLTPTTIRIMSSPYLRCIQTATPTSQALGIPIGVEEGLAESHFAQEYLPTVEQRWSYFPHLDLTYNRLYMPPANDDTHVQTGGPCESFPDGYFRRMLAFAHIFTDFVRNCKAGDAIIMFSHAASVALVAALLGEDSIPWKLAPCGVFSLEYSFDDDAWSLAQGSNGDNQHVSSRSLGTMAWGFSDELETRWLPIKSELAK